MKHCNKMMMIKIMTMLMMMKRMDVNDDDHDCYDHNHCEYNNDD